MSDRDSFDEMALDRRLRREGEAWRQQREGCPDPDLMLARGSEALDPDVRERLEAHVASCGACARLAADVDALRTEEREEAAASRVLARVRLPRPARVGPWLGLAAGLVLAAGLGALWWTRPVPPTRAPESTRAPASEEASAADSRATTAIEAPPAVALWAVEPAPVRVPLSSLGAARGGEGQPDASAALIDALMPYRTGDFAAAAVRLEEVTARHPDYPDGFLYLGVSYLMADRPAAAVGPLERARELAPAGRRSEIEWYLATAEQRTDRLEASRVRLRALCAASGGFRTRACAALAELE